MIRNIVSAEAGAGADDQTAATVGQRAYTALRERILMGEWLPGAKLTLRGLAAELGTSVQPVREAISRLSAEGALILKPNASLMIPGVDRQTMDELFHLRNFLEGEAARLATPLMTEAELDTLEGQMKIARTEHLANVGRRPIDRKRRVLALQTIAMLVAQGARSRALVGQILQLRMRTAPYYAAAANVDQASDRKFVAFGIQLQEEFFRAVRRRDANEAAHIRFADLYTYQRFVYRCLGLD